KGEGTDESDERLFVTYRVELRLEVRGRARLRRTTRISDPAPRTSAMEPRRNRGVRCIRLVRRPHRINAFSSVPGHITSDSPDPLRMVRSSDNSDRGTRKYRQYFAFR